MARLRLAIITSNIFFGDSLKSLLQDYHFENGMCLAIKDFSLQNSEALDVIVSDYKLDQLNKFLQKTKMQTNKIKEIEKIFITEKQLKLLPKNNIYLQRPFRFIELIEVLYSTFERLKSKRENKKTLGCISFIIPDRKLIYKDKKALYLTEKESDIIVSLLNSTDRGITREEIMSKVWMLNPNMETHTFETHLYRLRKKIKEKLLLNNFIMNKKGRYYLNHELTGKEN